MFILWQETNPLSDETLHLCGSMEIRSCFWKCVMVLVGWITLTFFSCKSWSAKLPSFFYRKQSTLSRSKECLPLGINVIVHCWKFKAFWTFASYYSVSIGRQMPCKRKSSSSFYTVPKPWRNIIYLLLFVKYSCVLSFAHLKLTTWLDVSWSYLPSAQGAECHNESREMSSHQF